MYFEFICVKLFFDTKSRYSFFIIYLHDMYNLLYSTYIKCLCDINMWKYISNVASTVPIIRKYNFAFIGHCLVLVINLTELFQLKNEVKFVTKTWMRNSNCFMFIYGVFVVGFFKWNVMELWRNDWCAIRVLFLFVPSVQARSV